VNAPAAPIVTPSDATGTWHDVCALDDIPVDSGVAALIGRCQVAVVRLASGDVHAVSNFDPFSKAFVIARGIVGDQRGVPKISSPIYKQSFDLRSGSCLDDATVALPVYAARVVEGRVWVRGDD